MRKTVWLILILIVIGSMIFSSCDSTNDFEQPDAGSTTNEGTEQEDNNLAPKHEYVGEYQKEPVYQKLMQFETCKKPDVLCQMLSELYGEEFTYIKMEQKSLEKYEGYKAPYEDFICSAFGMYKVSSTMVKGLIKTDTYAFFKAYSEEPSFIMDADGTYITYSYKTSQLESGATVHSVNNWVVSDLFMCLHGYIDGDTEKKDFMRDAVRYMDYYLEFENLIIDSLAGNSGSILKTQSLNPSIDILSVEITGPTMHELNVQYRINNLSQKRGVVYLTCSGHAPQDEMHFNDDNFKNDYRADGCFDYDVYYGSETPATFTIFYGYGDFDPYDGWDKECMTTVTILFAEDFGEISSETIPASEIYPLYFNGEYVGAWTIHTSRDLVEINGNTTAIPFSKHNVFRAESGSVVTFELVNESPVLTVDGVYIGAPIDVFEYDNIICYTFWHNDESFSINRYPNDGYIRIQNAWSLVGNGDMYLYP